MKKYILLFLAPLLAFATPTQPITNGVVPNGGTLVVQSGGAASVTGTGTITATGLTGSPNISVGTISASGAITVSSVAVPTISSTNTLTNKRNTARVLTVTSSATPTANTDNADVIYITALAAAITNMSTNLTGTPAACDQLEYWIVDDGTARAISWGSSFTAGPVALPTTTVLGKALHVYFERNPANTSWFCQAASSDL